MQLQNDFFTQKKNDYFRRWEASRKDDQNNGSCVGARRAVPLREKGERTDKKIIAFEQSVYDRLSVLFRVDCSPPRERRTPARQWVFDPASMT
jgi:hypothetical protein